MWQFCEKCKEVTPHKLAFDERGGESYSPGDDDPYYRCEVCAGNIAIEFARGYREYVENRRKKAGVKDYKISES